MRVLWVDADESPFTDPNGWRVLEDFGLQLRRLPTVAEATPYLRQKDFDLLLVRAELDGAETFLVRAHAALKSDARRVVLASSTWSKAQFKSHSKTPGAAHRYARVPMPPEGFLALVADLFNCAVEDLGEFTVPSDDALSFAELKGESAERAPAKLPSVLPEELLASLTAAGEAGAGGAESEGEGAGFAREFTAGPAPAKRRGLPESEDVDTLRRYLRLKEEQLDLSDGERRELAIENERIRKDAHTLQLRLRELENLEQELTKKVSQMEEERREGELRQQEAISDHEREQRHLRERLRALEHELGESGEKYENLRERVRKDIRKVRENERDLEARLELLRRDSETLLRARDERVLELQRKIDALEYDLDQVQDGKVHAQIEAERYLAKLSRVARALQIATGLVEDDHASVEELDELAPFVGGAANAEEPAELAAAGPVGAEAPPAEAAEGGPDLGFSTDLEALANDGEPTQMLRSDGLHDMEGDPESQSG